MFKTTTSFVDVNGFLRLPDFTDGSSSTTESHPSRFSGETGPAVRRPPIGTEHRFSARNLPFEEMEWQPNSQLRTPLLTAGPSVDDGLAFRREGFSAESTRVSGFAPGVFRFADGTSVHFSQAPAHHAMAVVEYHRTFPESVPVKLMVWAEGVGPDPEMAAALYTIGMLGGVLTQFPIDPCFNSISEPASQTMMVVNDQREDRTGIEDGYDPRRHAERLKVRGGILWMVGSLVFMNKIGDVLATASRGSPLHVVHKTFWESGDHRDLCRVRVTSPDDESRFYTGPEGHIVTMSSQESVGLDASAPAFNRGQAGSWYDRFLGTRRAITDFSAFETALGSALQTENPAESLAMRSSGHFAMVYDGISGSGGPRNLYSFSLSSARELNPAVNPILYWPEEAEEIIVSSHPTLPNILMSPNTPIYVVPDFVDSEGGIIDPLVIRIRKLSQGQFQVTIESMGDVDEVGIGRHPLPGTIWKMLVEGMSGNIKGPFKLTISATQIIIGDPDDEMVLTRPAITAP